MHGPKNGDMAGWAFADIIWCVWCSMDSFDLILFATGQRDQCPTSYQWVDLMQWECGDTLRPLVREMVDQVRGKLFLLCLIHSGIDTLSGLLHEVLLYIAYYALWDVGLSYGVFVHRAFWSILMMLCCLQEEVVRCVELPLETTLLDQKWSQLMPVG